MASPGQMRFLVNLRAETATPEFDARVRPQGWLLPPAYASAATIAIAQARARQGTLVIADNGLFDDIARIAAELDPVAAPVRTLVGSLRMQVAGPPTRSEVPASLREAARDVADLAELQTGPLRAAHTARAATLAGLGVTEFVGAEDPGPGVWSRLGIAPEGLAYLAAEWRAVGRRVARAAVADRPAVPAGMRSLPVASPMDEASARYIGDEFARAGIREVAIGFGALMATSKYASRIVVDDRAVPLPGYLPVSYVESVVTLKSFLAAYERRAGTMPDRLHLLGLGAPIMLGLAALLCRGIPDVTADATSPIRDAVSGTLYSDRPTLLKLDPNRVAMKTLGDARRNGWTCDCGSCRAFHAQFPQDAALARREWDRLGRPQDIRLLLVEGEVIGDALPLLALSRPGGVRGPAARRARLGHNHWSLTRLCVGLTEHLRAGTLDAHVAEVVDRYVGSASPAYAAAIRWAHAYITGG